MKRVLVCANPDLNLIDGSAIWLQTITLALAETGVALVDFLAKTTPSRTFLFDPLIRHNLINIIDPSLLGDRCTARLSTHGMVQTATTLDNTNKYDIILLRGFDIVSGFMLHPSIFKRCWVYLTDIPQQIHLYDIILKEKIATILTCANRILYQTQGFLNLYREIAPNAPIHNFFQYSPVVPDVPDNIEPIIHRPVRAIYAGKFKSTWNTLQMARTWPLVKKEVPNAELVMIGDKIHNENIPDDYHLKMRFALEHTPGLTWLGATSRDRVQKEIQSAKVGLSWRDPCMDDTLEYSTKLLEYGRGGCAAILNRNALHESLLGIDYPLFANTEQEYLFKLKIALTNEHITQFAADRLYSVAKQHTFSDRVKLLKEWLSRSPATKKKTILLAGHDFKFFNGIRKSLEDTGKYHFIVDEWQGHSHHDVKHSKILLRYADVIVCEWCLGNIRWYSHNKLAHQRLVARLHLQEKDLPYLQESNMGNIDHITYVNDSIRKTVTLSLSFPEHKTSVIANLFDETKFRPSKKMETARYALGMIGITPQRKRVDLTLDTLQLLLRRDSRYNLRIKGSHPFDYKWILNRPQELEYYRHVFRRINSSDELRYRVIFDPPGDDVNRWLTLVGFILSPSDFESFHLSIGEGMLTGCVPIIWNWDGAKDIWPQENIVSTPEAAAEKILSYSLEAWNAAGSQAREYITRNYPVTQVIQAWIEILEAS